MSVQNEPESEAGDIRATDVAAVTDEKPMPVVGIGASAGGLKALERFFQHLPEASGMAFVIVQHLAPDYKSELVMLLQRHTSMTVAQVREGVQVQPNTVYVIPPNKVLTIDDSTLHLTQRHRQVRQLRRPLPPGVIRRARRGRALQRLQITHLHRRRPVG